MTYTYLSDGPKLESVPWTGTSLKYRGNFVYEDDGVGNLRPASVAWDEGRIRWHYLSDVVDSLEVEPGEGVTDSLALDSPVAEDGICDEWQVKDHLGSVRAIVGIGNEIVGIRELNTYLPFGTRIPGSIQEARNRHRFTGKEEQRFGAIDDATGIPDFDSGQIDFGTRYYDTYSARWTTLDPLAGKYASTSPFVYCEGNPVRLVDSDGQDGKDKVVGAIVGVATNIIPFSGVLRDTYSPTDRSDYNSALKIVDNAAASAGFAMTTAGMAKMVEGAATAAAGGALALSVVGASGGAVVATAGAKAIATGAVATGMGTMLMANSAKNKEGGYGRGSDNSDAQISFIQGSENSAKRITTKLPNWHKRVKGRINGQKVYSNGKDYISDGHNGGIWKKAKTFKELGSRETRMGTYDEYLNRIGD